MLSMDVNLAGARRELAAVERETGKLVQAIKDGVSALAVKNELLTLEARKAALDLFNRVQFGPPNTAASTAANNTFGQVTAQANQPRLIAVGVPSVILSHDRRVEARDLSLKCSEKRG
jgi:hypothetical protein